MSVESFADGGGRRALRAVSRRVRGPARADRRWRDARGNDIGAWDHGHGAEAPGQDGWIPAGNCNF